MGLAKGLAAYAGELGLRADIAEADKYRCYPSSRDFTRGP